MNNWFSEDLHTEYDALRLIRRQRLITAAQYKKAVEKLVKADDRAFNKAEDAKLKAKEAKAKAERAKARALKAKANAIKTGSSKYYSQITDFTESWFFFKDNFKGTAQVIATILTGEGKELDINITLSKEKRTFITSQFTRYVKFYREEDGISLQEKLFFINYRLINKKVI